MGPVPLEVTADTTYGATFTFNVAPFATRRVFIDTAQYNTTGQTTLYTPSRWPPGFPPWIDHYKRAPWGAAATHTFTYDPGGNFSFAFQIDQIGVSDNPGMEVGDVIFASADSDATVRVYAFSSLTDIPQSPKTGFPTTLAQDISLHFGLTPTAGGVHLFWKAGTPAKLYHALAKGTSPITSPVALFEPIHPNYGISSCRINDYSEHFLAVTVVGSDVAQDFARLLILNENDLSIVTSIIVNTGNIDSSFVDVTQNPRSKVITLGYISASKPCVSNYIFSNGTLTATSAPILDASVWTQYFADAFAVEGYSNFETSVVGLDNSDTRFKDASLHLTTVASISSVSGTVYDAQPLVSLFAYDQGKTPSQHGTPSAGLLIQKDFFNFEVWTRPLVYPEECRWDETGKVLHIEGPPFSDTNVTVTAFFPEPLAASSSVEAVNAAGGVLPFTNSDLRIIASSGAQIKLAFTGDMMTASFPVWVGNADGKQIRMFGPASAPVSLAYQAADSRTVTVETGEDLLFNTTYYIQIASDVLGANGTQLWEAATYTLRTQTVNSGVLASEVLAVEAFSDEARTVPITAGSEINATTTLYLQLRARDPAFNTIDLATVTYLLDAVTVATLPFTQPIAATETFLTPALTTSVSYGQPHTLVFQTASTTISLTFTISFPSTNPVSPASGATAVPTTASITIQASEPLDQASFDATTVRLLQAGAPVAIGRSWNPATRIITITPDAEMAGSTLYTVECGMIRDPAGNPQVATLSYTFTTADVTPPTFDSMSPASGSTGVTIDKTILLTLSEAIATPSVTVSSVRLFRTDGPASFSVSLNGPVITIDPDDAPGGALRTDATYTVEIGAGVKDLSGNAFSNTPATFSATFRTQPATTPPTAASSFILYRDPAHLDAFSASERVSATAAVYLKFTGTDGATQTRDVFDATLRASWGPSVTIPLTESTSNSGGLYFGNYTL